MYIIDILSVQFVHFFTETLFSLYCYILVVILLYNIILLNIVYNRVYNILC